MKEDIPRLQKYLRKVFHTDDLRLVMPPRKSDMAEIFIKDEQIATLSRDEDDDCYQLQMAILDIDLDDA
jgi:hypothetical protein